MKVFGLSLRQYIEPIKYYIAVSVLVVISQYYIALPSAGQYPFLLNVTQALWALMVALSVYKLVKKHDFGMKNLLFTGVLYSFIIHGLKAFFFRVFLFPYSGSLEEVAAKIIWKFLYGSFLVFVIVLILGMLFVYLKSKNIEF